MEFCTPIIRSLERTVPDFVLPTFDTHNRGIFKVHPGHEGYDVSRDYFPANAVFCPGCRGVQTGCCERTRGLFLCSRTSVKFIDLAFFFFFFFSFVSPLNRTSNGNFTRVQNIMSFRKLSTLDPSKYFDFQLWKIFKSFKNSSSRIGCTFVFNDHRVFLSFLIILRQRLPNFINYSRLLTFTSAKFENNLDRLIKSFGGKLLISDLMRNRRLLFVRGGRDRKLWV